jgi:beta-mannanase
MKAIRRHGAIPFFSWASDSLPLSTNEPDFQLADLSAGAYDGYIRSWASAAKAWGHPFFLRFNWEMNSNWFPWVEGVNGNGPGSYVAAWRHVHDLFASVGARNVTWVWCPNTVYPGSQPLAPLYPGDAYVDWTCIDSYNGYIPPVSFANLFGPTYSEITGAIATTKPLIIGETASTEAGGSKSTWITQMLQALPSQFPKIKGVLWMEKNVSGPGGYSDWPIESSASAQAAFAAGIGVPAYAGNQFGSISSSPIPPPAP